VLRPTTRRPTPRQNRNNREGPSFTFTFKLVFISPDAPQDPDWFKNAPKTSHLFTVSRTIDPIELMDLIKSRCLEIQDTAVLIQKSGRSSVEGITPLPSTLSIEEIIELRGSNKSPIFIGVTEVDTVPNQTLLVPGTNTNTGSLLGIALFE
jgi:hypothetical protein